MTTADDYIDVTDSTHSSFSMTIESTLPDSQDHQGLSLAKLAMTLAEPLTSRINFPSRFSFRYKKQPKRLLLYLCISARQETIAR